MVGTPALITCKPGHFLPSSGNVTFLERDYSLLKDSQESEREGTPNKGQLRTAHDISEGTDTNKSSPVYDLQTSVYSMISWSDERARESSHHGPLRWAKGNLYKLQKTINQLPVDTLNHLVFNIKERLSKMRH